jgi:predicted aldo/keto reductase-like oxidoreductase
MGKALAEGRRDKVFLMTKLDGRTREGAARQIDESLKRLRTDRIDLMQIHEIIRPEDPEHCFREDGCVRALEDARRAGKIRYTGFTGHKDPSIHLKMLEVARKHKFHFDAVQMPLNVMDAHYRSFAHQVLPVLVREGIAVLGMKPLGSGVILESKTVSARECLRYALSLPTSVVITGIDSMEVLQQALATVRDFKQALTRAEIDELLGRTVEAAKGGRFEPFKTTTNFDGTTQHPEWLS